MTEADEYQPSESQRDDQERSQKQVLIRNSDMQPDHECTVVSIANVAIEEVADLQGVFQTQKYSKMAGIIKKQLDEKFGEGWFVICGKNFGNYVTHQLGTFMHFSFEDLHICVFRAR